MGHPVSIENVSMYFGRTCAVSDLNVHIRAGEFFSFLGPSGCGKTTLLKLISGFLSPTKGRILIDGRDMEGIGPNRRPTAMIFQNLALFPLMTVEENIGFGLDIRRVPIQEKNSRISDLLNLVDLPDARKKPVTALSGGQKQRVAIARALAVEPSVLLLDEPLSALDLKLRKHMRTELRHIQQRTGVTFIYITHDQGEALTMSDRIGVISEGGILHQVGTPSQVYNRPETAFVASFVGENNAIPAKPTSIREGRSQVETPIGTLLCKNPQNILPGSDATAFIRPEAIRLVNGSTDPDSHVVACDVVHQQFEGAYMTMLLKTENHTTLTIRQSNGGEVPRMTPGDRALVALNPESILLLAEQGDHDLILH